MKKHPLMEKPNRDFETAGGHLLFVLAATAACLAAPLLPLQTDSAYAFFRLLQQPAFNIDDLRTLNPLTWAAMQTGVRLSAAPRTLALVFALSQVAFGYVVFLVGRYGFRYRRAGRLTLALMLVSAPLWLNPANGTLNGLFYFALAYMLLSGERWTAADTCRHQAGAAGRLQAALWRTLLFVLLLLCVLSDPVWLLAIAAWLLYHPLLNLGSPQNANLGSPENPKPQANRPNVGSPVTAKTLLPRLALLVGLPAVALLDRLFLPRPLDFNLDFFLPVYGFRNLADFCMQPTAYAYLFLWAGWAYLVVRYICRKAYRPLVALLLLSAVFVALFGLRPGYADDFGRHFLPFWVATALLVLQERQPAVFLAAALLFAPCASADAWQTLKRRQSFYRTLADNLPEPHEKFLAYNVPMPENSFQPSGFPQVEMLNYTLLYTARPRVVQFPLPGVKFQSPYEADLSFKLTDGLSWPSDRLNPHYFPALYAKGSIDILPPGFFGFRPVYGLRCTAETYARDRANHPYFICQTWPDSTQGLTGGPELVELQCHETAFEGEACVKVGGGNWYRGLPVTLNVQSGDSLIARVKRQGDGHLGIENYALTRGKSRAMPYRLTTDTALRRLPAAGISTPNAGITAAANAPADTNTALWDELEIRTLIPEGVHRVVIYVAADSARTPSYFDDLEIRQLRRPF